MALAVAGTLPFLALPANASAPAVEGGSAGRFIVTLRDGSDARGTADEYHRRDAVVVDHVYEHALNGFAGQFTQGALGRLQADGRVIRIERDGVAQATENQSPAPSWGLDRVDQRYLGLDNLYGYDSTGAGVNAYVIDTGIRATHSDFVGRVGDGYDFVDNDDDPSDCNGHGTHVAGTIGGTTYGEAKAVTLHAVRVLNCRGSGTWSGVIAGMDWVASHAPAGSVANMSLGGGASSSVDEAANNLAGIVTLAVAAGNSNADACNYSPARAAKPLTVGATTSTDARASYSNFGSCLDLFAPGSSITSAWSTSDSATNTISGTSMATPHVVGAAARLIGATGPTSPDAVMAALLGDTTADAVSGVGTASPNRLLFTGAPVAHAPTVTLAKTCSGTSCALTGTGRDADGDTISFAWIGADAGSTSTTALGKATGTATKTYAAAGTYSTSVTATANGDTSSAGVSITCAVTKVRGKTALTCS